MQALIVEQCSLVRLCGDEAPVGRHSVVWRGVPNPSFRRLFEKETVTMLSCGGLMNGCVRSSVCFQTRPRLMK
uniref:Uncharacterized protein n=1 Tax=Utricularia reniformis TaxID=192314 RepID=A0A1Y0B3F1_9LAMI|nr:hypothetical protein AEK19_MT1754 [Utricularia reniformis]ART31930.1 hypothetical protein AEK19_MT1754 [Utricularia reniformis]